MSKRIRITVILVIISLSTLTAPKSTFAGGHFGVGYQVEDQTLTFDTPNLSGDFNYNGATSFHSPLDGYRIDLGFDLTKNLSVDFSLFNLAESTVYTHSFSGGNSSSFETGDPSLQNSLFTISDCGWIGGRPVMMNSDFSGSTKVRYRANGGNLEFIYNFPTGWPKKDVIRVKGFLGHIRSKGVMTTDFEVNRRSASNGGEILVNVDFSKEVIVGYEPQTGTYTYYTKELAMDLPGGDYAFGLFRKCADQEIIDYKAQYGECYEQVAIVIPIEPTGEFDSTVATVKQSWETAGAYLGLSFTYDIIKNLDLELACRRVLQGYVRNEMSVNGFSAKFEDDQPDIAMFDLIFTAHFVKDVALKAIYSKTFADYSLGGVDYDEQSSKISLVLDWKF